MSIQQNENKLYRYSLYIDEYHVSHEYQRNAFLTYRCGLEKFSILAPGLLQRANLKYSHALGLLLTRITQAHQYMQKI